MIITWFLTRLLKHISEKRFYFASSFFLFRPCELIYSYTKSSWFFFRPLIHTFVSLSLDHFATPDSHSIEAPPWERSHENSNISGEKNQHTDIVIIIPPSPRTCTCMFLGLRRRLYRTLRWSTCHHYYYYTKQTQRMHKPEEVEKRNASDTSKLTVGSVASFDACRLFKKLPFSVAPAAPATTAAEALYLILWFLLINEQSQEYFFHVAYGLFCE